jgi:nitrogen fixation/metabolism regulation signal transduction histidine kinase
MQRHGGSGQPVKGQSANRPEARNAPTAQVSTADLQEQLDRRTRERDEALEQLALRSDQAQSGSEWRRLRANAFCRDQEPRRRVEIRICDNGTGIPPDVKERLFTPFFTTKPAGEGTGLGLSISHDIIVKQHGGSIEVDTQPGEFSLTGGRA